VCDPDRTARETLGLRETTDTVQDPSVPTVFALRPDLEIHSADDGYWCWGRPSNEERLADDPFARIFPARVLEVGAGVPGAVPALCGPPIERYGSAQPWP
jgi:hypothetical protein